MKTLSVPIDEAQTKLRDLVKQVKAGVQVTITTHGQPAVVLGPAPSHAAPWRVEKPDDPGRYGDLQSPVMEPWS